MLLSPVKPTLISLSQDPSLDRGRRVGGICRGLMTSNTRRFESQRHWSEKGWSLFENQGRTRCSKRLSFYCVQVTHLHDYRAARVSINSPLCVFTGVGRGGGLAVEFTPFLRPSFPGLRVIMSVDLPLRGRYPALTSTKA